MTLTNGKIGSISEIADIPTRQQEGDEAQGMKFCDECGFPIEPVHGGKAGQRWRHELPQGYTYAQLQEDHPDCFNNPKLPETVQLEDETTLPAMDVTDEDKERATWAGTIAYNGLSKEAKEAICCRERHLRQAIADCVTAKELCDRAVELGLELGRREAEAIKRAEVAEAERDALKAASEYMKESKQAALDAVTSAEVELSTLRAVVGQETPQDAWIKGFSEGLMQAHANLSHPESRAIVGGLLDMDPPPYTPPLKAGQ